MKSRFSCPVAWPLKGALLLALHGVGPAGADDAGRQMPVADTPLSAGAIVVGILNYTAWPGPARPRLLCITRTAPEAAELLAQFEASPPAAAWQARLIDASPPLPQACDAVFLDAWQPAALRETLRALATRPVLSIGRGAEFCSDGGLFCLSRAGAAWRFETNLDAVARSGLRVNPGVLRLARPRPAAAT